MNKTIVIDAGHGGDDFGNTGNGIIEKDLALEISNYIGDRLKELNIPYYLTRTNDKSISIDDRIRSISTKYGTNNNIILISNHINKGGESGLEIIYALRNNDRLASKIFGEIEKQGLNVNKYYQLRDQNDTSKDFYPLLRDTPNYETIMIEYGYLDNKNNAEDIKNNYQKYAEAVVKSLADYTNKKYVPPITENKKKEKKGDSLYQIAIKYNTKVEELKRINNLTTNNLSVGQVLKIPKTYNTYIVKEGDTLYKISRMYNISVEELKRINNLTSNILKLGQSLKVPKINNTYIVQKGDTLYKIARMYNISVEELKKINNLTNNVLSIGQIIKTS